MKHSYDVLFFYRDKEENANGSTSSLSRVPPVITPDTQKTENVRNLMSWETKTSLISNERPTISNQVTANMPTNLTLPLLRNASLDRFMPHYGLNSNSTNL